MSALRVELSHSLLDSADEDAYSKCTGFCQYCFSTDHHVDLQRECGVEWVPVGTVAVAVAVLLLLLLLFDLILWFAVLCRVVSWRCLGVVVVVFVVILVVVVFAVCLCVSLTVRVRGETLAFV